MSIINTKLRAIVNISHRKFYFQICCKCLLMCFTWSRLRMYVKLVQHLTSHSSHLRFPVVTVLKWLSHFSFIPWVLVSKPPPSLGFPVYTSGSSVDFGSSPLFYQEVSLSFGQQFTPSACSWCLLTGSQHMIFLSPNLDSVCFDDFGGLLSYL